MDLLMLFGDGAGKNPSGGTYMLTNAVEKIAGQQLHRAPSQCFLLPLDTEHKELLLLLLTERLAVTDLGKQVISYGVRRPISHIAHFYINDWDSFF